MTTMNHQIRRGVVADAPIIAEFNQRMARETEDKILDTATITRGVTALLEDAQLGFYLVAVVDDRVVGCLAITYEWSDWRNGLFWWIQSVYVDESYRGRGVFSSLYETVKQQAMAAENTCGIRLYVERDNLTAQKTYHRLGMIETEYRLLEEEF